jgi:hypothetical protein
MRGIFQIGARQAFVAVMLVALSSTGAPAEGILDFLFGTPPQRSAPPLPQPQLPSSQPQVHPGQYPSVPGDVGQSIGNSNLGRAAAYCVRMCDGRYFPVERHANVTATQICSAFCPATPTKIYNGGEIAQAVAADGARYVDLKTAYLYRKTIVKDCTCNGRDIFGLVTMDVKTDPTLRAGDTVSTGDGVTTVARGESYATPTGLSPAPPPLR